MAVSIGYLNVPSEKSNAIVNFEKFDLKNIQDYILN